MAPTSYWFLSLYFLFGDYSVKGFYIPGVAPSEFSEGDLLETKV